MFLLGTILYIPLSVLSATSLNIFHFLTKSFLTNYLKAYVLESSENMKMRELFTLRNSTSGIYSVMFKIVKTSIGTIHAQSSLLSCDCIFEIMSRNTPSPLLCEGDIHMERMKMICSEYPVRSIFDCVRICRSVSCRSPSSSSVEVKSSLLRDIRVYERGGGVISGVDIGREAVIGCSFVNVSRMGMEGEKKKKEWRRIRREECVLRDSMIVGGENGIYGDIVSGITETIGDGYVFVSNNNTFVECHRHRLLHYRDVEMNEDYSNENYTTRIVLSNASSHTVTNSTFTNCSSSNSSGGALYFSSYYCTYIITITNCTFTNCSASGYGGAIYCKYASSCIVNRCSFDTCTNSDGGGGIYIGYISSCANVKDSNFSLCSSTCGGGLVLDVSNVTGTACE